MEHDRGVRLLPDHVRGGAVPVVGKHALVVQGRPHAVKVGAVRDARLLHVVLVGRKHVPEGALLVRPALLFLALEPVHLVVVLLELVRVLARLPDLGQEVEGVGRALQDDHPRVRVDEVVAGVPVRVQPQEGLVGLLRGQELDPLVLIDAVALGRLHEVLHGNVQLLDDDLRVHPDQVVDLPQELVHQEDLVPVHLPVGEAGQVLLHVERVAMLLRVLEFE
eukprot:UN0501